MRFISDLKMGIWECDMAVELEVGMRMVELGKWELRMEMHS